MLSITKQTKFLLFLLFYKELQKISFMSGEFYNMNVMYFYFVSGSLKFIHFDWIFQEKSLICIYETKSELPEP